MTCSTTKPQAQRLVEALRRRWMSHMELEELKISQCPWKRLSESGHRHLKPGEQIKKRERQDGLLELRVVRG